jgi:cellulose synthase/poly-beta-1,6-N-acetylglucosamine synthase-like glycosyltransferase
MNNNLIVFLIFWGVWILIPILVDGVYTLVHVIVILIKGQRMKSRQYIIPKDQMPLVSIIVPTYNEEQNIDECLNFMKIQTYPHQKIEVIIVDNGSSDRTGDIVREHIIENRDELYFNGKKQKTIFSGKNYIFRNDFKVLRIVDYHRQNKAHALNLGLEQAKGEIIINIDCRARLAPEAIYNMVAKFIREPDLGACTGNIEITWRPAQALGQNGRVRFLSNGFTKTANHSFKEDFLAKCQFLEYLTSFRIGREFLEITHSMYTLSGAFSAFRRSLVQGSVFYQKDNQDYIKKKNKAWYSDRTVTEDTDLTLSLQNRHIRIGYAPYAKAYLKPVTGWQRLYAQRVRWHRGEIEVYGYHQKMMGNQRYGLFGFVIFPFTILIDHTLGFPRLIWTALLPLLILFGYSLKVVVNALILMVIFYMLIDFFNILICYPIVDRETKNKIKQVLPFALIISFFRFSVFYFRMSGFLIALKEEPKWTVSGGPIEGIKKISAKIRPNKGQLADQKEK